MPHPIPKAIAVLSGIVTIALGSVTALQRMAGAKPAEPSQPCAPRLLEGERAVCEAPLGTRRVSQELAELALHAQH
jgi:hypothetical protein